MFPGGMKKQCPPDMGKDTSIFFEFLPVSDFRNKGGFWSDSQSKYDFETVFKKKQKSVYNLDIYLKV